MPVCVCVCVGWVRTSSLSHRFLRFVDLLTTIALHRYAQGYVSIVTNKGSLNLELHCDLAPLTCENFLTHCENGYYNDTVFHRLIPGFMVRHAV
jgi:Cyclophilin type peptidyl-prolyl cis-trans isomerase/CLD